jgi:GT2 family glycosyltransferase
VSTLDVGSGMPASAPAEPLATVIIVNWNGAKLLSPCLDAVAAQRCDFPFRTVVVDNASVDGSADLIRTQFPWVELIETGANLGFAGGNNAALHSVQTPFAVLLNNDAYPEPDWLATLLAAFDAPGGAALGAVTGKVVFLPRFAPLTLSSPGFVPGPHDSRDLGVQIHQVCVDGRDVTTEVLWEKLTYGAEGAPGSRFFWTRPAGELLVPVPASGPVEVAVTWAAEAPKSVSLDWSGGQADLPVNAVLTTVTVTLPAGLPRVDVLNNVGGIVLTEGYGADRGYQQIDTGQFDAGGRAFEPVFTGCGNGLAMRTELGHELGWFDDDFFLYYEDTDLSWRLRALGWDIGYVPGAALRHVHSATSEEWSPLFVFHVDRNRLLMLTKNASAGLALRAVGRYPLTTASIAVRTVRQAVAARARPPVRPTLLRLRVIGSYLRLLPRMLRRRGDIHRTATVSRARMERWLVTPETAPTRSAIEPDTAQAA